MTEIDAFLFAFFPMALARIRLFAVCCQGIERITRNTMEFPLRNWSNTLWAA
jgi:hypothetical protein